jgi:uncharacterized delta-60 repeat protein
MHHLIAAARLLLSLILVYALAQPIPIGAYDLVQSTEEFFSYSPATFTIPGKVNAMIPLSNGRVVVGGGFVSIGGLAAPRSLAMLNSDGTLDTTFRVDPDLQVQEVNAAALQGDGKILIAGRFKKAGLPTTYFLLRLQSNGTLDITFDPLQVNGQVYAVLVDGSKIVIGGDFTQPTPKIARLNLDGTADPAFRGVGSGPDGAVIDIARQSSGKYIIAGDFSTYNSAAQNGLARLNSNGSLDTSFVSGGFRESKRVAVLSDDSVVVGGTDICGDDPFAWYTANGAAKPALSPNPDLFQSITAVLPLPDGGFLVGGWYSGVCINGSPTAHEAQVWRYAANGTYRTMTSFGDEADVLALALRSDGRVVVGGYGRPKTAGQIGLFDGLALLDLADNGLEKVSAFKPLVGDEAEIYDLSRYADGRLLVAGNFSHVNGSPRFGLARLLANSSLDTNFRPFADQPGGWSQAALALPDGRAVAGFRDAGLYLIAADGSLTNLSASNHYDRVSTLERQSDGKVLVGSDWGAGVRRLKADFSGEDDTFVVGNAGGSVYDLAVQADGKILVAGSFNQYNGQPYPGLVRLNADGNTDNSFAPPLFMVDLYNTAMLYSVTLLASGKVLAGGNFGLVNGEVHPALARLNSNGSLDESFTSPANVHTTKSVCVQANDGSIWLGGQEASFSRNPIVRHLDSDGVTDPTFQDAYQAAHGDGLVNVVLCDSEGLSWVGGRFSLIGSRAYYGLARYLPLNGQLFLPLVIR